MTNPLLATRFLTKCSVIEVNVGELKQLFNAIDPSPFRDKDLDPKAEEFIVGWAKDLPRDATLALVVDLDREAGLPDEAAVRVASRPIARTKKINVKTCSCGPLVFALTASRGRF